MELEKELIEIKSQLSLAILLANKAMEMAIQATVDVKVAKETQVQRVEIPEPSEVVKEFIKEMQEPESEPVPTVKAKLSPFMVGGFNMRQRDAKGIDQNSTIDEDGEVDAIWESTVEGEG